MILSSKSLLKAYKANIGPMGGDESEDPDKVPAFDRSLMIAIIAVGLAIGAVGVVGLYTNLVASNFGMTLLSLLLALAGVSSALGVYREFVSMKMIAGVLNGCSEETAQEIVPPLLKNNNMALVQMLLDVLERLLGGKGQAKDSEEAK